MNVNLDATTRAMELMSPSRLAPIANITGERVWNFVDAETSLIGSFIKPKKAVGHKRTPRQRKPAVPA